MFGVAAKRVPVFYYRVGHLGGDGRQGLMAGIGIARTLLDVALALARKAFSAMRIARYPAIRKAICR